MRQMISPVSYLLQSQFNEQSVQVHFLYDASGSLAISCEANISVIEEINTWFNSLETIDHQVKWLVQYHIYWKSGNYFVTIIIKFQTIIIVLLRCKACVISFLFF